ncbi:hypothetical protein Q604_UNBC09974G0002, partial [human gut metagenome]
MEVVYVLRVSVRGPVGEVGQQYFLGAL